jgi:hypothetical protein
LMRTSRSGLLAAMLGVDTLLSSTQSCSMRMRSDSPAGNQPQHTHITCETGFTLYDWFMNYGAAGESS